MLRTITAIKLGGLCLMLILAKGGCQTALAPERTPDRTVVGFLKAVGRGDIEGSKAFVIAESQREIQSWLKMLYFPDHETPPSQAQSDEIDHFIGLFYQVTPMKTPSASDAQLEARLLFSATDALIGFPSVANNPLIPNRALYMVTMSRTITGQGKDAKTGPWMIVSIVPTSEKAQ